MRVLYALAIRRSGVRSSPRTFFGLVFSEDELTDQVKFTKFEAFL